MSDRIAVARSTLIAAALLAAGAALADDAMKGMAMPAPKPGAETPADRDFARANAAMMKDMAVKPTGHTDLDFVNMMLPHHRGAVDMAKVELQYGTDPMLRKLAADIVKAQESEIAEMQAWKAKNAR